MGQPPAAVKLRYGRVAAAGSSLLVTLVALLGGAGVIDTGGTGAVPVADTATLTADESGGGAGVAGRPGAGATELPAAVRQSAAGSGAEGSGAEGSGTSPSSTAGSTARPSAPGSRGARFDSEEAGRRTVTEADLAVPADSGTGKRVVFDQGAQRVWLVRESGEVARTYLVSGSLTDNLDPGAYEVYSKSEQAWGIDDSGTMRYMVRFAHGERAAIGFHDIPVKDGERLQTRAELGTPRSHGCIRQWRPDARALWGFAPIGTSVVVVA